MTAKNKHPILKIKPLGFQWETSDPFLFCVHHLDNYPKGNDEMGPAVPLDGRNIGHDFDLKDGWRMYHGKDIPGFPGHPHRGFETITIVCNGLVDHADSTGASGRYGNGDVQWMTSGKGIQHSEMFPLLNKEDRNPLELFQIWLNLPMKNKMVEPYFKMMWRDTIPKVTHLDKNGKKTIIDIIAGTLSGTSAPTPPPESWASDPENSVGIFNIKIESGANFVLSEVKGKPIRTIYFYHGDNLMLEGESIDEYHAIDIHPGTAINLYNNSQKDIKLLVLQGEPINEPVVQHGPFVMNSIEEIQETIEDFHHTQFGGWPWPKAEQVHEREKGRFAMHANGTEEIQ